MRLPHVWHFTHDPACPTFSKFHMLLTLLFIMGDFNTEVNQTRMTVFCDTFEPKIWLYNHHLSIWQIIPIVFKSKGWQRLDYPILISWQLLSWEQHLKNSNQISYITETIQNFWMINVVNIFPSNQLKMLALIVMAWKGFYKDALILWM